MDGAPPLGGLKDDYPKPSASQNPNTSIASFCAFSLRTRCFCSCPIWRLSQGFFFAVFFGVAHGVFPFKLVGGRKKFSPFTTKGENFFPGNA
jgi:hypothetical protein